MIRNIVTLTLNDVAIACKNKTIFLVFFIPLFVFLSLKLVDRTDGAPEKIKIGLIEKALYPPVILRAIQTSDKAFILSWFSNKEAARRALKEKQVDGVLLPSPSEPDSVELTALTKASFQTLAIVEGLSALQIEAEGKSKNWISEINAVQEGAIQKQTLPTWVLMLVLLIAFIILPAQVAEEKEKRLLLGLLQTPIKEIEWLAAKLCLGMILINTAVIFLHLLGRFDLDRGGALGYGAFLLAGGFCFSAFGIFLGFCCRTQASARTLGVLFYLPHLLPSALSDFSQKLNTVAPLLPSYQFYGPIKAILLEGAPFSHFWIEGVYLLVLGLLSFFLSYLLIKKRWLM